MTTIGLDCGEFWADVTLGVFLGGKINFGQGTGGALGHIGPVPFGLQPGSRWSVPWGSSRAFNQVTGGQAGHQIAQPEGPGRAV